MKWLIGLIAAAIAAWVKSIADREYVRGYQQGIEDVERYQKILERQMKQASR